MAIVDNKDGRTNHNKVEEALDAYRKRYTKLLQERGIESNNFERLDLRAAQLIKEQKQCVNARKQLGPIPGVEVGDEFRNRAELTIVGLHYNFVNGIDYMEKGGKTLATSIVNSGRYANCVKFPNALIYSGEGGNPRVGGKIRKAKDQKLERENLALMNSMQRGNSVRVIRAFNCREAGTRAKNSLCKTYVYDGLYKVCRLWEERDEFLGKLAFKFLLIRNDGQPRVTWEIFSDKSKRPITPKDILRKNDISQGKEKMHIHAVNEIDNESPPSFNYICINIYPDFFKATTQKGCDCSDGCFEFNPCPCVMKNGGVLPYDNKEHRTNSNFVVYECGPSCKCYSSCKNRVSQHGIQFKLEVFRTKSKGWGVRSSSYIANGSFICEYIGEIVHDASQPFSFSIISGFSGEGGLAINSAKHGNVGRFVNDSRSPNLIAQRVLYDYDDMQMAHVMLFAGKDIPPKRELTYVGGLTLSFD